MRKIKIISGIYFFFIVVFAVWGTYFMVADAGMLYGLVCCWLALPILSLISSSFVAYEKKKWMLVLPIVNGGINAGLHYLTFHCVGVEMIICAVCTSVFGLFLGICLRKVKLFLQKRRISN